MALNDPVSCLLCLDAFERTEMLRVQLRAIAGNGAHQHLICQKCGGAIAAEYLYVQQSGKEVSAAEPHDPQESERLNVDGRGLQNTAAQTDPAIETSEASTIGEEKTAEAPGEPAESPKRDTKKGRKESL